MHSKKRNTISVPIVQAFIALCIVLLPWPVAAQSPINSQFLPFMVTGENRSGTNSSMANICELTGIVLDFATHFMTDAAQQRPIMECDPILMRVAQERAGDMAANGYFDHTNLAGQGPNYLVREAGYTLANGYGSAIDANQIESIAAGVSYSRASSVWMALRGSPFHKMHVLGEDPFFREQNEFGIGYVYNPDSRQKHFWVLLTAKPAN